MSGRSSTRVGMECPATTDIEDFLFGQVHDRTRRSWLRAHIARCPLCQRRAIQLVLYYDILAEELEKPVRSSALWEAARIAERTFVSRRFMFEPKTRSRSNGRNLFVKIGTQDPTQALKNGLFQSCDTRTPLVLDLVMIDSGEILLSCCGKAVEDRSPTRLEIPGEEFSLDLDKRGVTLAHPDFVPALERSAELIVWTVTPK